MLSRYYLAAKENKADILVMTATPIPRNTLEDYKMSATFFMLGNKLLNDEETVKKVANSHSEVGYHSFNHTSFIKQKLSELKNEYQTSNEIFYNLTNH